MGVNHRGGIRGSGGPLRGVPSIESGGVRYRGNDNDREGVGEGTEIGEINGKQNTTDKGMRKAEEYAFCRLH